jgi:bifunctional non-homologous end joining protein LigD
MARPVAKTRKKSSANRTPESKPVVVEGVQLSNPQKLLYPSDGISKLDLARYYQQVAEWMLPHVKNRLLSLVRCPAGSGKACFFQKHPGASELERLRYVDVDGESEAYLAVNDLDGLISLVQLGVLEIHLWGSLADRYEKPDRLVIDLDPDPSVEWTDVVTSAKQIRLLLEELGLESFLKTTGGKGLHVVIPVQRRTSWDDAKAFCRAVADFLVAVEPSKYIAKMSKAARKGKIFVDYLRNDQGATSVAPYSTRNRRGAPVSVPIAWEELNPKLKSDQFNIHNLSKRLSRLKQDPWADIPLVKQSLSAATLKKLRQL